jgi:hypothetical protein
MLTLACGHRVLSDTPDDSVFCPGCFHDLLVVACLDYEDEEIA